MGACLLFSASGALAAPPPVFTPVVGSPFGDGKGVRDVAFSPTNGLLASANDNGTVSVFSVSAGCAVTVAGSATIGPGTHPLSVAFSLSGGLTAVGSAVMTGAGPASVAFSLSGGLLATANTNLGTVSAFSVSAGGVLTEVPGSPFAVGNARAVAFSQRGGLLAVAQSSEASSVAVFSVTGGGALTPVAGSPYPTGGGPFQVAGSPDGHLVATANSFNHQSVGVPWRRARRADQRPCRSADLQPGSIGLDDLRVY